MTKLVEVNNKAKIVLGKDMLKGEHYLHNDELLVVCVESNVYGGKWVNVNTGHTGSAGEDSEWFEVNIHTIEYSKV